MSMGSLILILFLCLAREGGPLIENRISVKIKEKEIQKFSFDNSKALNLRYTILA